MINVCWRMNNTMGLQLCITSNPETYRSGLLLDVSLAFSCSLSLVRNTLRMLSQTGTDEADNGNESQMANMLGLTEGQRDS